MVYWHAKPWDDIYGPWAYILVTFLKLMLGYKRQTWVSIQDHESVPVDKSKNINQLIMGGNATLQGIL